MVRVPRLRRITQPVRPSEVPSCKFYFPCDEGAGNILRCPITGAVWDAATNGHALQWGTVANAVRMSVNQDFIPTPFTSGAYPALSPTKHWTYIAAARVISNDPAYACRIALGDNDDLVNASGSQDINVAYQFDDPLNTGFGWGIGDGPFHTGASSAMSPKTQMQRRWRQYPAEPDDPLKETVLSVDTATDIITLNTAHSFVTGDMTEFEIIFGSIEPLVNDTLYYVIKVDATRIKVATTKANALAGTAIDLTSASVTALNFYYANDIRLHGYGKDIVLVSTHVPATSFNLVAYDLADGSTIAEANVAMTGTLPAAQSVTFEPYFRFSNYDLYGLSLHESAAALPNLAAGAKAQAQNWVAGKKELYEGWMGVT